MDVDQRPWTAVRYDSMIQNHGCTLRQHSAAVSLLKVPSQRTTVILADAAVRSAASDLRSIDRLQERRLEPAAVSLSCLPAATVHIFIPPRG